MQSPFIQLKDDRLFIRQNCENGKTYDCLMLAIKHKFKVREIAKELGISVRYLHQLFVSTVGESPKNWLKKERMRATKYLLAKTKDPKKVSKMLGFSQYTHFCKEVKDFFQITPLQLLKEISESELTPS